MLLARSLSHNPGVQHAARLAIGVMRAATRRFLCYRRNQLALRELAEMDDRGLRDIGLSRGDVRAALRLDIDLGSLQR